MSREQWDAVVIGSGLGGLACAAYRLGPRTEIPGLYFCGASTPWGHGIGSVLDATLLRTTRRLARM